jgi:zinc finger SWIM domain-containing protein 3
MSCSRCKGEGHNKATCKQPTLPLEHAPALALDAPAPAPALNAPAPALNAPAPALDAPAPALALVAPALALDAPAPGGRELAFIAQPLEHATAPGGEELTLIEPCPGSPSTAQVS